LTTSIPVLFATAFCAVLIVFPAAATEAKPDASAQNRFQAAHAHFLEGRNLQRLHRNTERSRAELTAAYDGYRGVVDAAPNGKLAARALYMSGSAQLFLAHPENAVGVYQQVIERYPGDRYYLAKSLVKMASVQKNLLDTEAGQRALQRYHEEFPDGGPEDLRKQVARIEAALTVIGKPAAPIAASRWFNTTAGPPDDRGKLVLVYFWATWCPNCRKEVDFINDLWDRYQPKGLRLVGVTNNTRGQTDVTVQKYIQTHSFSFPIAIDADGETSRGLNGGSVPSAVLIDGRGQVRWHDHPAALNDAVLDRLLAVTPPERS